MGGRALPSTVRMQKETGGTQWSWARAAHSHIGENLHRMCPIVERVDDGDVRGGREAVICSREVTRAVIAAT